MTVYSFELLPVTQEIIRALVVTFLDASVRINAATGMTFMTAACGISVVLTQDPFRRMRIPVNASMQPVNTLRIEPRDAD
jgi:hypothetical protein